MVSRKVNGTSGNESSNDHAIQLAINYVRDFSAAAASYHLRRSDESLILLNRCISLLSTSCIQPQHFNPSQLEIAKFFTDLHSVIGTLSADSDVLWACVSVLQQCSRNLDAHRLLVEEYRFVPLLTFVLQRTQAQDKVQRLLVLLQELTYGIRIAWEEPYIIVLIQQLVELIYNVTDDDGEAFAQLALSILINICHNNFVVLFLFLRTINMSTFSQRIKNYGMLANKMLIILSEDIHAPEQEDLHLFVRSTFASIDDCFKQWNVPHLRHIVDFLVQSKTHSGLNQALLSYAHYCEDIERLLNQLDARCSMDDSADETRRQQQICVGLFFQLIQYVLELSTVPLGDDGSENIISIDSIIPRIFELVGNWMESDVCGVDAVNLLNVLVRFAKMKSASPRIAVNQSIIVQLIATSEKPETTPSHSAAILQLLLTLLHQSKTEKLILSKITESFFDKIFAPLLAAKPVVSVNRLALVDIEKPILCLLLLINFAGIAKKAYFDKCTALLKLPQIQQALASAMVSGNELVCGAVFQISQFEYFPQKEVAKHIAALNVSESSATQQAPSSDQWRHLNTVLKTHRTFISKETEERLQALIDVISKAHSNNQLGNVAMSQIIELYNFKIEKALCVESSMQNRLQEASNEITNLTHRISLQNAELHKYTTMNFELHISKEGLQSQCMDLVKQRDKLKRNTADLLKKLNERSETLNINEKRLAVKCSEMIVLQKDYQDAQLELQKKTVELEKLHSSNKENVARINNLKKTIGAYEVEIREKKQSLDEKERDLARTQKALDEQKEAKKKSDDVVTVLETQLQEKNEQIRNYELELSETEEMRKTIMSLMESKKPKRKA